jgi:hypothetical protein
VRPIPTDHRDDYLITMYDLEPDVCRTMLAGTRFGRVGFDDGTGPVILPVNALFSHDRVLFRTAPGSLLDRSADGRRFAFEVDHADDVAESGWSLLVLGPTAPVVDPDLLRAVADTDIHPWAPAGRDRWIGIRAEQISGRIIRRQRLAPDHYQQPYMPPD